ncbi:TOG array regulator of axonemal microtubules protein 1-like isoform X2 [Tetranychus urticae]|uniref:TOG array regulator of axonemal microtubules protein 1-like isoform X2 n=1 Tax=Tetranychus urticae TaxID=32264 RepID=UPI00077B8643|nr:TOG array regulator of axonemal microtubules protein 1-like isoform X2 [Tetranychus urticae]
MIMGDFETPLEATPRSSMTSSAIPIVINDPNRHGTLNPTHRHQHLHHDHPNQVRRHPVTLHLNTSNNTYPSELATLLRHVVEHSGSRRADVLRDLRRLLKKSGGQLPDVDRMQFFEAFYPMLIDDRWKVVCECTMLIVDIIPQMGEHDLDPCMAIILPRIVPNLGHEATDVRRASLRLLHVYMRYTNNLQKVLRLYIQYGLESHDKSAQKGCVLSLPLLFTEEFSKENLFPLVQSLGHLLVHSDASLFYPIFLAMQRLHSLVGNETFRLYLQHLSQETVSLYHKVLSRASTADSNGRNEATVSREPINGFEERNKEANGSTKVNLASTESPIEAAKMTTNDIQKPLDEPTLGNEGESRQENERKMCENPNESRNLLKSSDSVESASNSSESKAAFTNEFVLIYGIFPVAVHNRATSTKMNEKLEGLNQMMSIVKEAPDSHVAGLIPYLPSFLDNFINSLVNNPNFKVTLTGLEMIEIIVGRLGASAYPCLQPVIDILLKRLGDGRSVVREHDIKVIHRLMLHWPPQNVLDILLRHKFHRNPKVREEIINRVTFALLMFPRTEFNLDRISYEIATMLIDPKRQVRLSALESIAVIAQALGPARLDSLMSIVSIIEETSESEGLVNAVQARLARRDLPRCNPDGSLRYVLNVSNFSGWFPSTSEADIEWVLLASSSHNGTPPKLAHHYLGRFNEQYRRYTMKQAELEGFNFGKRLDESEPESVCNESAEETVSQSVEHNQIFQTQNEQNDDRQQISTCISSEDDKSQQSDESTKTISSRSKTADWAKKLENEFDKSSRRSSFSQLTDYNSHQYHHSYQNLHSQHLVGDHHDGHDLTNEENESQMSQSYNESIHNDNVGLTIINPRDNRAFSMPTIQMNQLSESQDSHQTSDYHHQPEIFYPVHRKSVNISSYPRSVPTSPEKRSSFQTESDFDISFDRPRSALKSSPTCPNHDEPSEYQNEPNSLLEVSTNKEPGSRRGSTILSPKDDQRLSKESQENQEASGANQRSVLPSVSIDEPTESEDNQSDNKSEGNNQMTKSLPNEKNDDDNCVINEGNEMANEKKSVDQNDNQTGEEETGEGQGGDVDGNGLEGEEHCDVSSSGSKDQLVDGEEGGDEDENAVQDEQSGAPEMGKESTSNVKPKSRTPGMKRKPMIPTRKRISRSSSPVHRQPQYHMIRIQPAIPPNANIRHIMENVVKTEGPFDNPQEALRAALAAFGEDAWTTKVEGMLAVTRLASFHPSVLQKDFHSVIVSLVDEVKNLRSSVSRSAIFTLGDLFSKMKKSLEPDMELIGSALLAKCSENASFIREDCEKALMSMVEEMPQIKSALILIHFGANHRNMNVRRTAAFFLSILVEKMGPVKCLMGPKDIGEHLLQSAAKFLMDGSPHTRFYGRKIFSVLLNHSLFDKLLRKHVAPGTYRNICGILDSIKRRGVGEKPADLSTPVKPQ